MTTWVAGLAGNEQPKHTAARSDVGPRAKRATHGSYEEKWLASALDGEIQKVRNAREGERNDTLNNAAFALGQLIDAGLDEAAIERELQAAGEYVGLGATECQKTIASGIRGGKREPRQIPEQKYSRASARNDNSAGEPPEDDDYVHGDDDAPDAPPASQQRSDVTEPLREVPEPLTIAKVIDDWKAQGPLVHEPTGISTLDELTGGGPVYGTRWYLSGAPDAGKTALLVLIAHVFLARGIAVGLLAVDEEAGDLVTRLAQRVGYSRQHCETRDPDVLTNVLGALQDLPVRFYDDRWTIESAAENLAAFARTRGSGAMLGIDSIQTVTCAAELTAQALGREMSEAQAVTARARSIRSVATRHRFIAIATSELGRSAYRSSDPSQQTSTMASSKWSGAIEYSARVLLGLRNVPGESDLIDVEVAKNKHGPQARPGDGTTGHVFLRIDRRCQTLNEASYAPSPEDRTGKQDGRQKAQAVADAEVVCAVLEERPGLGVRQLRAAVRARSGAGSERVDAAVELLGAAIERSEGKRNARPMRLIRDLLPAEIRTALEAQC